MSEFMNSEYKPAPSCVLRIGTNMCHLSAELQGKGIIEWKYLAEICGFRGRSHECSHGANGRAMRCCKLNCPVWDDLDIKRFKFKERPDTNTIMPEDGDCKLHMWGTDDRCMKCNALKGDVHPEEVTDGQE